VVPHCPLQVHLLVVSMESTAQYWQPVWGALERYWKPVCQKREGAGPMSGAPHLAQAQSNRGRKGRKKDFPDAERLIKRLVALQMLQHQRSDFRPSLPRRSGEAWARAHVVCLR